MAAEVSDMEAYRKAVSTLKEQAIEAGSLAPRGIDGGGGSGDDGRMEARLRQVEDAIIRIDTRMDSLATSAEVAQWSHDIIKWMVGTAIAISVAAITVMTFVLNHAAPKAPPPSQQPIIINVPASQAPAVVPPAPQPPG
jgi:hypothetical protein